MITDNRLPVDLIMDHQLKDRMGKYPLLVIPEWAHIDPAIRTDLLSYVKNGGNLLVIGANGVQDFKDELGVEFPEPVKNEVIYTGLDGRIVMMKTNYQPFRPGANAINIGSRLSTDDWRFTTGEHLATVSKFGKGKIAGIFFDMGDFYNRHQNAVSLGLISKVISSLVPEFISTVESDGKMHQVITRKNNSLYIHLINTNGPHNNPNVLVYDDVAPLKNIHVELSLPAKPVAIKLQPGNKPVSFTYKNGKASLTVSEVPIYGILEVSER
jgi:hypothetical protein